MAENEPIAFGPKAVEQIAQTVREVSRRMMNETPHRGRWQQREGGGGGETMWFTISEMLCPDGYDVTENTLVVTPIWYTGRCGSTPPGGNGDGTWNVYDVCSYLLDQVSADLVGTTGRASYFYPYDSATCEPRWIISDLCSTPECA